MTERTLAKRRAKALANKRESGSPGGGAGSKSAEARQRIISVAEALFTQRGFEGASMRDIAAAANMNVASSYYYFPSKEELLWAVWEKGRRQLLARAKSAL